MSEQKSRAIDLMIEDLHTYNPEIRSKAKFQGCERELDVIKYQLVNYLKFLRKIP